MYSTHNEEEILTNNLTIKGLIQANYKLLVEMFGEPKIICSDILHVEWVVRIGDKIISINNYVGVTKPTLENTALWPISCNCPDAITELREILNNPIPSIRRKIEQEMALALNSDVDRKNELLEKCARNIGQLCQATTIMCRNAEMTLNQLNKIL